MKTNKPNPANMKKLLLFIALGLSASVASAQCTPDMSVAGDAGIHPDSATNFMPAYVGTPYNQVVTAVVPADTCAQILPLPFPCTTLSFDYIEVTSVTGLPTGFTFTCAPANCQFMGNTIDCAIISGTAQPGQEGVYPLVFNLDAYVGGLGVPNSFTLTYYRIVVNPAVGTIELSQDAFAVSQNQPNPFDESTLIELETSVSGLVQFEVFNLIGQPVHTRTVSVQKGKNQIRFEAGDLPAGTYMYKVSDGKRSTTKRMVVTR